jgi:hypothetical protein
MNYVITTRRRAGRVTTIDNLSPAQLERTALAVTEGELGAYSAEIKKTGLEPIIVEPDMAIAPDHDGMTCTVARNSSIDAATERGWPSVVLLDDDLRFARRCVREGDGKTVLAPATVNDMNDMDRWLSRALFLNPLAGIVARSTWSLGYAKTSVIEQMESCRMVAMLGLSKQVYDLRFRLQAMSDFDFVLRALKGGWGNVVSCEFAVDWGPVGAPGGCSEYRTPQVQEAAARALAAAHPDVVRTVRKRSEGWEGFDGYRTDVRVQWVKAAKAGKRK